MTAQPENHNDMALLQQLRQGNAKAFSDLYYTYSQAIYRKILWMVNDEETAKELLQDLFMRLWENRAKIDLSKSFRAYLYTIAVNLVYDYFRRVSRKQAVESHLLLLAAGQSANAEDEIIKKENVSLLNDVIKKLPLQRRKVFLLCKVEGKSYDEVSSELNISRSTVQDHIVKANQFIKTLIKDHPEVISALLICSLVS